MKGFALNIWLGMGESKDEFIQQQNISLTHMALGWAIFEEIEMV